MTKCFQDKKWINKKNTSNCNYNNLKAFFCEQLHLEAFSMNNWRAAFIIFLLAYPHLLKGRQWCQDRTTDPNRVFTLWWRYYLDFHWVWCQVAYFLLHTISDTWIHGGSTWHDNIWVQVLSDIDVTFHDTIVNKYIYYFNVPHNPDNINVF